MAFIFIIRYSTKSYYFAMFDHQEAKVGVSGSGEVHGNIRCRNVMVWSHLQGSTPSVKLADPGLCHYYNTRPLHDPVNSERQVSDSSHFISFFTLFASTAVTFFFSFIYNINASI